MRIHYHTDCDSFAGCEQMLSVLLGTPAPGIEWSFTYRWSRAYVRSAAGRLPDLAVTMGVMRLPDAGALRQAFDRYLPRRLSYVFKVLTIALPIRQILQVWAVIVLWNRFRQLRPDVIHVNNGGFPGGGSCNAAVLAGRLAGVRTIVYVVNNMAIDYRSPTRWWDWPIDRMCARSVTRFVTGSRAAAQQLSEVLRLPSGAVECIHNGIVVRAADETSDSVRSRLGVRSDAILGVVVARLEPRKGHATLMRALARLPADVRDRLAIVVEGSGPEESPIRQLVQGLGIDDIVTLVGCERNIYNLLAASDLVILPSLGYEDFPNVILEAMALGKPVIGTRVGGVAEQIADGVTGSIVPPGDEVALADAIRCMTDKNLRESMGTRGRARFDEAFTARRAADDYGKLYSRLR